MEIQNIVFDFGGVLVDWNPRYLYEQLIKDDREREYFLTRVCTEAWNTQQDAGRSLKEATELLQKEFPQYRALIHSYYDRWEEMLKGEISANVKVLHQLKSSGYPMYGLTNWSGETFPIALRRFPFFAEFDGIVVSGDEKMIKPGQEIYFLLLERYRIKAENTLFIDDNRKNIAVAGEIGFQTVHFDVGTDLEQELKLLKVL
jgi:2-haloacid dehalogenase